MISPSITGQPQQPQQLAASSSAISTVPTSSATEQLVTINQCHVCMKFCKNKTGLALHLRACRPVVAPAHQHSSTSSTAGIDTIATELSQSAAATANNALADANQNVFEKYLNDPSDLDNIYNNIVFWRRNIFNLPSGGAG